MAKWRLAQRKDQETGGAKGPKGSGAPKRERKPGELSTFQKVVIVVFIVIFALSTLAGALASVFQSSQQQSVEYNVDYVDSQYADLVADLEKTLEETPDDKDALLQVARYCSSWGSTVGMLAQDDEERAHGEELLQRAIGYYDRYLELESTAEASTERALCEYYLGDTDAATSDLEAVTQSWPEYAPAWADLGMLYEVAGRTDEATAAYEKAVELDPDDEAGAKSFAEGRLEAMQESDDASDDAAASDDNAAADDAADDGDAAADENAAEQTGNDSAGE